VLLYVYIYHSWTFFFQLHFYQYFRQLSYGCCSQVMLFIICTVVLYNDERNQPVRLGRSITSGRSKLFPLELRFFFTARRNTYVRFVECIYAYGLWITRLIVDHAVRVRPTFHGYIVCNGIALTWEWTQLLQMRKFR
jgi:hypothetical protein